MFKYENLSDRTLDGQLQGEKDILLTMEQGTPEYEKQLKLIEQIEAVKAARTKKQ